MNKSDEKGLVAEIQQLLDKHPPMIPATRVDTSTSIYVRIPQKQQDKTTSLSSALEAKVDALIAQSRKRRSYVHALAMRHLTPNQYARALRQLTRHGYGVNVFPTHHVHPPLSMAVLGGHLKAVHALLQFGADPYLSYPVESGTSSPLQLVCELLVKYGDGKQVKKYKNAQAILGVFLKHGADLQRKINRTEEAPTFLQLLHEVGHKHSS